MEVDYLLVEDVVALHDYALDLYGGTPGREPGKLEGTLSLPDSGFGDYERFPLIEEKAAVYHYYLASGHCFTDGNKRTSYLAAFTFLDINGYDLVASDEEVYNWTHKIADDKTRPPFFEAVVWIGTHMHKREE
ncbi:type II toxin-antitoxin system death-on-curing family toxin [Peribacillus frigoritolerans]|uniref:Type II toxin-antitoxin system death-on-curing family toxin n=1 Tax=Peribacillus castrilensis TaxID=2897690 RepID=A0AAW9NEH3_9BACI|nr:type II toxin-antitoxin system death-on-curing family toxin [Peribacillus castrilensis]